MHTRTKTSSGRKPATAAKLTAALAAASLSLTAAPALGSSGGTGIGGDGGGGGKTVAGRTAKLVNGKAIPPRKAPARVVKVIRAANDIRKKPYVYGGGHSSFKSSGYDCSGAVSYALHRGHFVSHPLDSSGFMRWGRHGAGKWITVYANSGHAYAVIAGLRWDTSQTAGDGPSWSKRMVSHRGYRVRHKGRF